MRLRQIAIASYNLNEAERIINKELKIRTAYRDEEVEKYGLNNIVCPLGGEFLEVVSPWQGILRIRMHLPRHRHPTLNSHILLGSFRFSVD